MKKAGYFFFSFLPLFVSLGLQFLASVPIMGFHLLGICLSGLFSGSKIPYSGFLMQFFDAVGSPASVTFTSILYASAGIAVFGFWYAKQFSGNLNFPADRFSNPPLILGIVLMIPGLQIVSSVLTSAAAIMFPGWMDFYEELMETAGLTGSPSLTLLLYAVLLGPIAEELTFRGVVLSSAKKALPFWAANLFQALLFGIFHMNVIQGIYAFFVGLFLGYICERGASIWLSIFLHILFNAWGTLISAFLSAPSMLLLCILSAAGFFLFHKNTSSRSVKYPD